MPKEPQTPLPQHLKRQRHTGNANMQFKNYTISVNNQAELLINSGDAALEISKDTICIIKGKQANKQPLFNWAAQNSYPSQMPNYHAQNHKDHFKDQDQSQNKLQASRNIDLNIYRPKEKAPRRIDIGTFTLWLQDNGNAKIISPHAEIYMQGQAIFIAKGQAKQVTPLSSAENKNSLENTAKQPDKTSPIPEKRDKQKDWNNGPKFPTPPNGTPHF